SAERTSYSSYTTPVHSTTTASATNYGNTAYGTAHTTTTGGETYLIAKPGASNTIVCFRDRPEGYPLVYNAEFVYRSLSNKYGIATNEPLRAEAPEDGAACGPDLPKCSAGAVCRTS